MESTVRFLLKNSPALESLELVRFWESWHIGMSDPLYHTKQRHREPADTWTSKSRLKTLKIAGFHYNFDTLLKITRFTPHLRSLVLSDTEVPFFLNVSAQNTSMIAFCSLIQEHCPKLDHLTLEQSECIDARGFKALLEGMPRDLKSFTATREGDPEHKLWRIDNLKFTFEKHLEDLARFQGLETLKINHTKTLTFVNKDVLQLFPNLKRLELPHTTLRIQDMLEAAPWACNKSLVVLIVRILGPRGWAPVKDISRSSQNLERGEETSTQLGKTLGLYGRWTALLKTMPLLDCKAVIYIESD
ncbi:hypothetical protein BGZ81_010072 [Podila clonocystis]|nr:hypothetical protein BGZ81_010072 [Podila clonocystis]